MKISTILDKVDENQLFVPAFQREYVWKRNDAKELLDSLIKEYPTGTMLTWETNNPPELKGKHTYSQQQGAVRILLDGQQRITTLYMLIRGDLPPYYTKAEIANDTRGLYCNVVTTELAYFSKAKMAKDPRWQNITDIFQRKVRARDIVREIEEGGQEVSREMEDGIDDFVRAVENVLDREFPEQTVPIKASIREAIDIFYKVNASGVALTDAELALAQITGYWPQARDLFKAKLATLGDSGFEFKLDFIVYVLLGCVYTLGSELKKLHGAENDDKLREAWALLDGKVLDYVFNLMRSSAYIDHTKEVNSVYAFIPIIVYCFKKQGKPLTDREVKKAIKWFYYSQIKARYTSTMPQKLDRDLRIVVEEDEPFDALLAVIAEDKVLEIRPSDFEGRAISHPLFGLMRWYFKSQNAVCFTTGVHLRKNMGKKYQLEMDHIFPYSRLKKAGYGRGNRVKYAMAQEMTNRAVLTQVANRTKSAKTAHEYLAQVQQDYPDSLALQCVPEDDSLWRLDNYENFLAARRAKLAEDLNAFLDGITETEAASSPAKLEDLIADGESEELEFKSTLRWDMKDEVVNKRLENVVAKTCAAFANAQGGVLLIGVSDDGDVVGLEHDFLSLGGADQDKFERHLRGILSNQLGLPFVTSKVQLRFPVVFDSVICQIDVQQSLQPIVIKVASSSGQVIEKFYVRNGNASQELPMSDMHDYMKDRF